MKNEKNTIIVLIKLDVKSVYRRILDRKSEYLAEFSLKRTRDHFKEVFFHRYRELTIDLLKKFTEDLIVLIDQFYSKVDDILWYLSHTQDMVYTIENNLTNWFVQLSKIYENLCIFLDAEYDQEISI